MMKTKNANKGHPSVLHGLLCYPCLHKIHLSYRLCLCAFVTFVDFLVSLCLMSSDILC